MINVEKSEIIEKLGAEEVSTYFGHNNLIIDILERDGYVTLAYLIKRGALTFTKEELKTELDFMVENSLLLIGQWEEMSNLLEYAQNGEQRIANYFRKKRRFQIV